MTPRRPGSAPPRVAAVLLCAGLAASPAASAGAGFVDVAEEVGLGEATSKRAVFVDLDGDGWLDVVLDRWHAFLSTEAPGGGRRFRDVTGRAGLDVPRTPDLVIFGDVDGDGDADALSARSQQPERAAPDPADASRKLRDSSGRLVPAEPDDLTRTAVYLNDGTGRFRMLEGSGFDHAESTSAATFLDFDLDGRLDAFLGNWYREYGWSVAAYPDRLLRGRGDGTFEDVTDSAFDERAEPGHRDSARPTYGVTAVDWNDDGLTDLLTASYGRQWNRLWENLGQGRFADRGARTGFDADDRRSGEYPCIDRETEEEFRSGGNTFDIATADFDNDGDLDAYLGEITHWWAGPSSDLSSLLVNLGPREGHRFERRLPPGLARRHLDPWRWNQGDIHVGWLDFDNDTRPDLVIASGDYPDGQYLRLHRQLPDGSFREVTHEVGIDWEGSGSISFGDYDRDGDVDVLAGRSLFRLSKEKRRELGPGPALFRNDVGTKNRWLVVRLVGAGPPSGASRDAVGAVVRVRAGGVTQSRRVKSAVGHAGHQDAPELHFGLGSARRIARVEILWPDAARSSDVLEDVPSNRLLVVRQGSEGPPSWRAFRAGRGGAAERDALRSGDVSSP